MMTAVMMTAHFGTHALQVKYCKEPVQCQLLILQRKKLLRREMACFDMKLMKTCSIIWLLFMWFWNFTENVFPWSLLSECSCSRHWHWTQENPAGSAETYTVQMHRLLKDSGTGPSGGGALRVTGRLPLTGRSRPSSRPPRTSSGWCCAGSAATAGPPWPSCTAASDARSRDLLLSLACLWHKKNKKKKQDDLWGRSRKRSCKRCPRENTSREEASLKLDADGLFYRVEPSSKTIFGHPSLQLRLTRFGLLLKGWVGRNASIPGLQAHQPFTHAHTQQSLVIFTFGKRD